MTAKVAILKLAPNNSARFNSSGPTSRSLMQNSSSVYEQQQHRLKFGENGEKAATEHEYRHHHKRKKSKKKRDRSTERHQKSSKSSKDHLEDQLLYHRTLGASNDMHSVGLPSDGGGVVQFDLIQQDEDEDEDGRRGGHVDLRLDGPRHRKRKRDQSPSINDGDDDNNGDGHHVTKRSNNGASPLCFFDQPAPQQSRMSRTELETAPSPVSDEEGDDDDDFDLVSEAPYSSYPFAGDLSNNVSVVISTQEANHFGEEDDDGVQVQIMSDDDDEDGNEFATSPIELNHHHVEDESFEEPAKHHNLLQENGDSLEDQVEDFDIHLPNVVDKEFEHVSPHVDEDEFVGLEGDEVTSFSHIDVESLHTDRIPNVNGNFDSIGEFHQWHQSYAVESYSGEPLHILPYAVIDF